MIPRIEASSYCYKFPNFEAWTIANKIQSKRIRLCANVEAEEIGSVVAKVFRLRNIQQKLTAQQTLESVIDTKFDEIVRVRFIGEGKLETVNGCCSDFDVWRDLLSVKRNSFVWLGHNPSPRIDYDEKKDRVRVWIDEKYESKNAEEYAIDFTWREFKENVKTLNADLEDFISLLEVWAESFDRQSANELTAKFRAYLSLNRPY